MDETIHIEIRCQTAETSSSVKEWFVCAFGHRGILPCMDGFGGCADKLNITLPQGESNVRNLKIEDRNGHLHVLCHFMEE